MERYNGWANYDTWLVVVWLQNDMDNYDKTQSMTKEDIIDLDALDLQNMFYYGDPVNFKNVNVDEIIEMLLEQ